MAQDDSAAPALSLKERIAALNLQQVGNVPNSPPPSYDTQKKSRPPPPPPPARPARSQTSNNPPLQSNAASTERHIGNLPASKEDHILPPPTISNSVPSKRPSLPPRPSQRSVNAPPPVLPPRNGSQTSLQRKDSAESVSSVVTARSARSSVSGMSTRTSFSEGGTARSVKAPEYDPSTLPPLPPKRSDTQPEPKRVPLKSNYSSPSQLVAKKSNGSLRSLPPVLPSRPPLPTRQDTTSEEPVHNGLQQRIQNGMQSRVQAQAEKQVQNGINSQISNGLSKSGLSTGMQQRIHSGVQGHVQEQSQKQVQNGMNSLKDPKTRRSALDFAMNRSTETPPPLPTGRPGSTPAPDTNGAPPPIPLSSRPDLAALQASKPKPGAAPTNSCLKCRDFSGPDNHAARFPRQSIPSQDIGWIAQQLTSPFPSATDKARAIFTWLHHNIIYDTEALYNDRVQGSTPASTLASGLAVCEGYAALFAVLATKAGLEALVVSGHGKGIGWSPLPGQAVNIPPYKGNHAWSAVRIDGGEWKLVDACWGAGHVEGWGKPYKQVFSRQHFENDNDVFGESHFPEDKRYFFRVDGRREISYEEYMLCDAGPEKPTCYGGFKDEHGFDERAILPPHKKIPVYNRDGTLPATVRFQFQPICPHWDNAIHGRGKPYLFTLAIKGRDGRKDDMIPLKSNGRFWWVDVPREDLGAPGQTVSVFYIKTLGDNHNTRGLTEREFLEKRRRVGMSWGGVALWELV